MNRIKTHISAKLLLGKRFFQKGFALVLLAGMVWGAAGIHAAEVTEHQVKALCLLNFAKYVSWPDEAFHDPQTAVRIGILGNVKVASELKNVASGKIIAGRTVVVVEIEDDEDWRKCHIIFIGSSARSGFKEMLARAKTLPILTVGETGEFTEAGGVISFVKKENKVRFEINLNSARQASLHISSKLLSLADVVHGKD